MPPATRSTRVPPSSRRGRASTAKLQAQRQPPERILAAGEILGGTYQVGELLGRGGMAEVYEASDLVLGRKVAIKAARPQIDPATLRREARILAAIRQSVPAIYGLGEQRGVPFLVMERILGIDLATFLARRIAAGRTLAIDEVVEIVLGIADGLGAIHRAGIAHRDVKPANVMLAPGGRVVLMDLGLAIPEGEAGRLAPLSGTADYMAPETIDASTNAGDAFLVDVYALGVVAYELLTGRLPFEGSSRAVVLRKHLSDPAPSVIQARPEIPSKLAHLIAELLAKDPLARPQGMEAVAFRLRALRTPPPDERPSWAKLMVPPAREGSRPGERAFSILVVDADSALARVASVALHALGPGIAIATATSLDEATKRLGVSPPDLMIVGVGRLATELCAYLRGTPRGQRTRILGLGEPSKGDLETFRALGVTRFVPKGRDVTERLIAAATEARVA
jgi:serine/threonine-protein kinase